MAFHLFSTKPLSEPMLVCCQLEPYEQILVEFDQNIGIFVNENALENIVCRMATILSCLQCINPCASVMFMIKDT